MKSVRDVLDHKTSKELFSVAPIATVYEAIDLMSERHVGALPVLQENKLVGILSERDYARKVILKDRSSKGTRVSEIMTSEVITVEETHRIDECVSLMQTNHIRHLVVVRDSTVIGMLSLRDLFVQIIDEQAEKIDELEHYIRGEV